MYPYICKYFKFPIDHPIVHVGDTCKNVDACLKMDEVIRCTVVPPKSSITRSFLTDLTRSFYSACAGRAFTNRTCVKNFTITHR